MLVEGAFRDRVHVPIDLHRCFPLHSCRRAGLHCHHCCCRHHRAEPLHMPGLVRGAGVGYGRAFALQTPAGSINACALAGTQRNSGHRPDCRRLAGSCRCAPRTSNAVRSTPEIPVPRRWSTATHNCLTLRTSHLPSTPPTKAGRVHRPGPCSRCRRLGWSWEGAQAIDRGDRCLETRLNLGSERANTFNCRLLKATSSMVSVQLRAQSLYTLVSYCTPPR